MGELNTMRFTNNITDKSFECQPIISMYDDEDFDWGYFIINGKEYRRFNSGFREAVQAEYMWMKLNDHVR